jgi:hypothetical protein
LNNGLLALAVRVEREGFRRTPPMWELHFSVFNGTRSDIKICHVEGYLNNARDRRCRLLDQVIIRRGKISIVTIQQDIEEIPTDENHVVLHLSGLVVRAQPVNAMNVFDLALPDTLQFNVKNRWTVNDDLFVGFHRERLDSWD